MENWLEQKIALQIWQRFIQQIHEGPKTFIEISQTTISLNSTIVATIHRNFTYPSVRFVLASVSMLQSSTMETSCSKQRIRQAVVYGLWNLYLRPLDAYVFINIAQNLPYQHFTYFNRFRTEMPFLCFSKLLLAKFKIVCCVQAAHCVGEQWLTHWIYASSYLDIDTVRLVDTGCVTQTSNSYTSMDCLSRHDKHKNVNLIGKCSLQPAPHLIRKYLGNINLEGVT